VDCTGPGLIRRAGNRKEFGSPLAEDSHAGLRTFVSWAPRESSSYGQSVVRAQDLWFLIWRVSRTHLAEDSHGQLEFRTGAWSWWSSRLRTGGTHDWCLAWTESWTHFAGTHCGSLSRRLNKKDKIHWLLCAETFLNLILDLFAWDFWQLFFSSTAPAWSNDANSNWFQM
jgi:hypothetical protein